MTSAPKDEITFDGSSWESLTRLVTQSVVARILDSDVASDKDQGAWVAARFRGPALDWFGEHYSANHAALDVFDAFIINVRNQFGVSDDGLRAHRRGQLEGLRWQSDLPVFFAEFDRLTTQLHVTSDDARIALLRGKLPLEVQKLLSEQALDFHNYDTMRQRLLTMWALDPKRQNAVGATTKPKRVKCSSCGKKGHAATDCRSKK